MGSTPTLYFPMLRKMLFKHIPHMHTCLLERSIQRTRSTPTLYFPIDVEKDVIYTYSIHGSEV